MAKRVSTLADLDIAGEAHAQADGLAERLARRRGARAPAAEAGRGGAAATAPGGPDANAWRRGKALIQVAVGEEAHVELSIIAKRRRMTLSAVVKDALNDWLDRHGHPLRLD